MILIFHQISVEYESDEYSNLNTATYIYSRDRYLGPDVVFAIILGIHSIRAFLILKVSRTFGPMIEIIINMLREVLTFMVIQG